MTSAGLVRCSTYVTRSPAGSQERTHRPGGADHDSPRVDAVADVRCVRRVDDLDRLESEVADATEWAPKSFGLHLLLDRLRTKRDTLVASRDGQEPGPSQHTGNRRHANPFPTCTARLRSGTAVIAARRRRVR